MNGVPANGAAYIYPDDQPSTWELYQHLAQQNKQRQALEEAKRQKQLENEAVLSEKIQKSWSDKDIDSHVRDIAVERMKHYTDLVHKSQGKLSPAAIQQMMQDDLTGVKDYSDTVKNVYGVIKKQQEDYSKAYPNIKHNRAGDLAVENLLYTTDENGKKVLRSKEDIKKDIDSKRDFYGEALDQHPEELLNGEPTIDQALSHIKPSLKKDGYKVINPKGGYIDKDYSVNMFPFQEINQDKSGEVSLTTRHEVYDPTKGKILQPGEKPGRGSMPAYPVALQDDYKSFTSKLDNKMLVESKLKNQIKDIEKIAGHKIDTKSDEAQLIRRNIVYDLLNGKTKATQLQTSEVQKADPFRKPTAASSESKAEIKKAEKLNSKYNPVNMFHGILNGSDYDNEATDVDVNIGNGKTRKAKNLLPLMPNSYDVVLPKTGQQVKPEAIYFYPDRRDWGVTVIYKQKVDGEDQVKMQRVQPSEMKSFITNSARKNIGDSNFEDTQKHIESLFTAKEPAKETAKKVTKKFNG